MLTKKLKEEFKEFMEHCGQLVTCPKNCKEQKTCFSKWMEKDVNEDIFQELMHWYNKNCID